MQTGASVDTGEHFVPKSQSFVLTVSFQADRLWYQVHRLDPDDVDDAFSFKLRPREPFPNMMGMTPEERFGITDGGKRSQYD